MERIRLGGEEFDNEVPDHAANAQRVFRDAWKGIRTACGKRARQDGGKWVVNSVRVFCV